MMSKVEKGAYGHCFLVHYNFFYSFFFLSNDEIKGKMDKVNNRWIKKFIFLNVKTFTFFM